MKQLITIGLVFLLLLSAAFADEVDFSTTGNTGGAIGYGATSDAAWSQSFIPDSATGTIIDAAEFYLNKGGSPTDGIVVRIETDNAGAPSGTLVDPAATVTVASPSTPAYNLFNFSSDITLVDGTTYWFVIQRDGAYDNSNYYTMKRNSLTNDYADGTSAKLDASWGNVNYDLQGSYHAIVPPVSSDIQLFNITAKEYNSTTQVKEFVTDINFSDSHLQQYYTFNSGDLTNDLMGFINFSRIGASQTGGGMFENGYEFDGNDYLNTDLYEGNDSFYIRGYFKPFSIQTGDSFMISRRGHSNNAAQYQLKFEYTDDKIYAIAGNGATSVTLTSTTVADMYSYYYVGLNHNGTHVQLIVNGTVEDSAALAGTYKSNLKTFVGCGTYNNACNANSYLYGRADDVKYFSRSLTTQEIAADFANAPAYLNSFSAKTTNTTVVFNETYDQSGNNATFSNNGATYENGAYVFDGDDYLSLGVESGESTFYVGIGFTYYTLPSNDGYLISRRGNSDASTHYKIRVESSDSKIYGVVGNGVTSTTLTSTTVTEPNTRYTMGFNLNSTHVALIVNGIEEDSATFSNPHTSNRATLVGCGTYNDACSANTYFNGTIDFIKIYSSSISPEEYESAQYQRVHNFSNIKYYYPFERVTNSQLANIAISKQEHPLNYSIMNYPTTTNFIFNWSAYNISVRDKHTNNYVPSFELNLDNFTKTITTGSTILITSEEIYNTLNITPSGYQNASTTNINLAANHTVNQTFYTYGLNSVYVRAYYSDNSTLITNKTITIAYENSTFSGGETTTTGEKFIPNLNPSSSYTFTVSGTGLDSSIQNVTIGANTFQYLDVYLAVTSDTDTVFTIKDFDTNAIIEGATVDVETKINFTWTLINSYLSDISGRIQVPYTEDQDYRFTVTKSDYITKEFTLSPIIFGSYTVKLEKNITQTNTEDLTAVNIHIKPSYFSNDEIQTANLTISSPTGQLLAYNFNITTTNNNTIVTGSGTNSYGEILSLTYNIIDASVTDQVILRYSYILSDGQTKEYTRTYLIRDGDLSTSLWAANSQNQYNIPLFDRVLIMVVVTAICAGAAAWFLGSIGAGFVGMLVMGYFGAISFVSWWFIIIPMILLFSLMAWRSTT